MAYMAPIQKKKIRAQNGLFSLFSRNLHWILWEERGSNRIPTLEGLGCWEATEKRVKDVTGRADGGS